MSLSLVPGNRGMLHFWVAGLLLMALAVMATSTRDAPGVAVQAGMVMLTAAAAFLLSWRSTLAAMLAIWLGPSYVYDLKGGESLFSLGVLIDLPALLILAAFATAVRPCRRPAARSGIGQPFER